ncbi:SRF-type transcription factor [Ostertagia ostertagi]
MVIDLIDRHKQALLMEDSPELAQLMHHLQSSSSSAQPAMPESTSTPGLLPNGKKTKGRVKIKWNTLATNSDGIRHLAYELSTLTGTQVMLLVASETGHVYTYATKKLQPMISSDTGKALIQTCLNAPGDGSDLQPNRTEFTFETGTAPPNPRKRRVADTSDTTKKIGLAYPAVTATQSQVLAIPTGR